MVARRLSMELAELLHRVTAALEELDIRNLVTGSMATIAYGRAPIHERH